MELGPSSWAVQGANESGRGTRLEVSSDGVARTPRIRGEEGQVNKKSIEMTRKRQRERESGSQRSNKWEKEERPEAGELKSEY